LQIFFTSSTKKCRKIEAVDIVLQEAENDENKDEIIISVRYFK
jgi:hypothetical protein